MHLGTKWQIFTDFLFWISLSFLGSVAVVYLPLFGPLCGAALSTPLIIAVYRRGLAAGAVVAGGTGFFLFMGMGLQLTLMFFLFALMGLVLGLGLRNQWPLGRAALAGAFAILTPLAILMLILIFVYRTNPLTAQVQMLHTSMTELLNFYRASGMSEMQVHELGRGLAATVEKTAMLLPALYMLTGMALAGLNYLFASLLLRARGLEIKITPFSAWRFPWYMVWGYMLGMIMAFGGKYYSLDILSRTGTNLHFFFGALFAVQGLAVIWFFLAKLVGLRVIQVIAVIFIIFNPYLAQLTVWLGMFDAFFNYRKL